MPESKNQASNFRVVRDDNSISIQSGLLSLKFGVTNRVTFEDLSFKGKRNWLSDFSDIGLLWKIHFKGPYGTAPVYSNNEADFQKAFISKDDADVKEITFVWTAKATHDMHPEVVIRVRCKKGKSLSFWSLEVSLPRGWKIRRADFPYLSNFAVMQHMKVVVPTGWGNEYGFKPCFKYEGPYPSWLTSMQMVAFYDDKHANGLYFASHDPRANLKEFYIEARGNTAEVAQFHIPSIPDNDVDSFALDYEVVLGVFEGGYYEAGQLYRDFALRTKWVDETKKKSPPAWLKETELWLRPDGGVEKNLEVTKEALKFFDVKTALHWYRWHEIPYDTHYPEYLPALPGIAEAIRELQEMGTHVALYINGRLWDPASESWMSEKAYEHAARSENSECYSEIYGSLIPNNVMCPYTNFWQEKIAGIAERLEEALGIHGVYIDQVAAGEGGQCYNPAHGHPVGGGEFWRVGYEALLAKTRKKLSNNTILLTEENAECWLNLFDAHLMVNTQVDGKVVPLFLSVYSGKTILICTLYYASDEPRNSLSFRIKNALAFLWGAQPGWIQPYRIMAPDVRKEAEFLKDLVRTRRFAHPFIDAGKFLDMLPVGGNNPVVHGVMKGPFFGQYDIKVPAVSASAWLSPDNKIGVLSTNISDQAHEVKIVLPFEKAALAVDKKFKITFYNNSGLVDTKKYADKCVTFTLPERSAMILDIDM